MQRSRFQSSDVKNHLVAAIGEFVGTFLFLFGGFAGAHVASSHVVDTSLSTDGGSNPLVILYIAMSFAMSLAVNVWIFYRVSGGMFNPAVTLALVLGAGVPIVRGVVCVVSQLLAGICAAAVAEAILPGDLKVETTLGAGTSIAQGVFLEMFLTAQLIITIFMLAVEKTKATFLAPLGIGASLFVDHMIGVYYTGASMNPARSFGPAVAAAHFDGYHWIYWVGPIMGALVATGLYKLFKFLDYEAANPDQDVDLTCSAKEDSSRLACTANRLGLESADGQRGHSSKWSRSKDSDLESGSPPQSKGHHMAGVSVRSEHITSA